MAGSRQSKRVSWPSDENLCKVRLFLSEDAPYQSGRDAQDHLQAKTAWLLHAEGLDEPDDSLPPGFEAAYRNHPIVDKSQIPLIKWQHPRRFVLAEEWRVVAGEESQEHSIENFRQQGVLEAIYPRPSSIPPNPLVSADVQATHTVDDKHIPLVPITAIEDEDAAEHSNPPLPSMMSTAVAALGAIAALGAEPDLTAAAAVAYAAIAKSSEENSLIDRDLLVKLLRDPSMVNELLTQQTCTAPQPLSHRNIIRPPHIPNLPFASSSERATAAAPPPPPQVKDVSYYKSLIQKHGKERQEGPVVESANQRDMKAKMQRPCSYFNTPRGCRNGAGCMFLHDASLNVDQQGGAGKRIKLDGGIAGRN